MKVIIDASNVAHYGKRADDKPRLKNISSSIEALKKLGYEVIIIADASLRHEIDEKESFNQLLDEGKVQQVPSGTTADHYILKLAE
ncbi:MAG: Zc3h12a-like ribonuclease, partial [Methanobacterium sp.]|nr:Zc3h12a-like ribonuclease [Euryarchaeota archaeon]MBV1729409.1 Zc3h12a-like ribonuclease [Methanobacterium sp.]